MKKLPCIVVLAISLLICGCNSSKSEDHVETKPACLPSKIVVDDDGISVQNVSSQRWTRIHVQVNDTDTSDGFIANIPALEPGQALELSFSKLLRDDGLRFDPKTYAVDHVAFRADQGRYNQIGCDKAFTHQYIEKLKGSSE